MKAIILGCGGSSGTPQIGGADGGGDWGECDPTEPRNRRTRASIIIETPAQQRILVDTGPDLRAQLTAQKIPRIDAIIYTHAHADHIAGLDEIRILNRLLAAPMPAYADEKTWGELAQRFDYAFKPWPGGGFFRPVLAATTVEPGQTIDIAGIPVTIINQDHGFSHSLGLRIGNFAYCTDVVRLDEAALNALQNLDIFIIDCFTRRTPHPTHANLDQVLAWVVALHPKRTILTHMGSNMDYQWLRQNLPAGIEAAHDGLEVYIDFP